MDLLLLLETYKKHGGIITITGYYYKEDTYHIADIVHNMHYPNLTQEKIIINKGHTISIIHRNGQIYGYIGEVDFSNISLYKGKDIYSLKKDKVLFPDRRWATILDDGESIHLFCTYHKNNKDDLFKFQNIYWYMSADSINFTPKCVITDGSAPWIMKEGNIYYLFYHRKTDLTHDILVKQTRDIFHLYEAQELTVGTCPITNQDYAWSAPSIVKIDNIYWMTTEVRLGNEPWRTIVGYSNDILGPYHTYRELLYGWRACCFQYIINRRLQILYSIRKNNNWKLAERHQL